MGTKVISKKNQLNEKKSNTVGNSGKQNTTDTYSVGREFSML
ncbi:MAG: hypothetical protein NTX05_08370 [Fusobacteria bacterium]|nr:hypothetical protein [Fusobacteriota bacterium]